MKDRKNCYCEYGVVGGQINIRDKRSICGYCEGTRVDFEFEYYQLKKWIDEIKATLNVNYGLTGHQKTILGPDSESKGVTSMMLEVLDNRELEIVKLKQLLRKNSIPYN